MNILGTFALWAHVILFSLFTGRQEFTLFDEYAISGYQTRRLNNRLSYLKILTWYLGRCMIFHVDSSLLGFIYLTGVICFVSASVQLVVATFECILKCHELALGHHLTTVIA